MTGDAQFQMERILQSPTMSCDSFLFFSFFFFTLFLTSNPVTVSLWKNCSSRWKLTKMDLFGWRPLAFDKMTTMALTLYHYAKCI